MAKNTKNIQVAEDNEPFDVEKCIKSVPPSKGSDVNFNTSEKKPPRKKIVDTSNINEDQIRNIIGNMDILKYERDINLKDIPDLPAKSTQNKSPAKLRKFSLQEYKETLLTVPRINDRRTVFISNDIREEIVNIVRKLGIEKSSVSGFIENLLRHHLEIYREDVGKWIKQ